jgi:hypothetical protein
MVSPPVTKAAIAEAAKEAMPTPAEQLELIPTRFAPGTKRHAAQLRKAAGGRPRGSGNIASREVIAFVKKMFGDPMVESARWLLHTPETLAAELGCSKLEAFDRLERIRSELRKFFYAPKSPVDDDGKPVPVFNLVIGGAMQPAGEASVPWLDPATGQAWGAVIDGAPPPAATARDATARDAAADDDE